MPKFVSRTRSRLAPSLRQRLRSLLSQPARPTCDNLVGRPFWFADEKTMLHLGDDLTGDLELGRDPVETVGVQPNDGLGDHGGGVELVGNRDPVLAAKSSLREPATNLAPEARRMGAFALDAPAETRPATPAGIVIDADNAQVLQPA